ncbi:MAG: nitroreductase family protein, partial [Chloroflexota bacterium]
MGKEHFESIGLIDGLHSTPSRRYLSNKPISDAIIWDIIDAAIRGPSGGNKQGWAWMVIRDKNTKTKIAHWYLENWNKEYGVRR